MEILNYFTSWRTNRFECPACRWKGLGSELALDVFEGLTELRCPSGDCDEIILGLPHPTTAEVEAAAASGSKKARMMLAPLIPEDD